MFGKNSIRLPEVVSVPISLYKSMQGRYFVGYADNLVLDYEKNAWARLYNPKGSGVNLHVNVWTVTAVGPSPIRAQIWFNAQAPGVPLQSDLVTSANLTSHPLPKPKVKLQYASEVTGEPTGGIKGFVRRTPPETTIVAEEDGKFILGEGDNFIIFLSNPETPESKAQGRVAFGWWEEPIHK